MAKYTVKYPNGKKIEKYALTNDLLKSEEKAQGKVHQSPSNIRIYNSHGTGKYAWRKSTVRRNSKDVKAINAQLEAVRGTEKAPAIKCAGKRPWGEFVKCMKAEMSDLIKPVAEEKGEMGVLAFLKE